MTTRQELYDRIRTSSKDEVILDEMIRLGFWPRGGSLPEDPADEIRRRGELERELRALTSENRRLHNVKALKNALRKQRLEESRRKKKEAKERKLREREEKAAAWQKRMRTEVVYLGQHVSGGLNHRQSQAEKLNAGQLPVFSDAVELAKAMGISVSALRFLAFTRKTSRVTHYRRFAIKKKTGGVRHISAPMPRLKRAQEWILENILERVPLHQAAHGFRRGRSIVTNAEPHVGSDSVINLDIQDFFPTVSYRRVKGMFQSLGYSESVATVLALLTTEPTISEVGLDRATYYVAGSERYLPQGAPTSPAITNIICRGLDARLTATADELGFRYTRYADDITFSGPADARQNIGRAIRRIGFAVSKEGFLIHPKKTRVQRRGSRQEVTGLTVNERVSVPRFLLRKFRATLQQIEKDGPAGKSWGSKDDVIAAIEGFANFVHMVDPQRGQQLMRRVDAIIDRHGRGRSDRVQRRRWAEASAAGDATSGGRTTAGPSTAAGRGGVRPSDVDLSDNLPPDDDSSEKKPWWKFW